MSKVYFTDLRTNPKRSLLTKVEDLLNRLRPSDIIKKGDIVAIKAHFGEPGNTAYLRPIFLRRIVEKVKELDGRPFITDTNTLYRGGRSDAVAHLETAIHHGFDYACIGCPIIIADGLRGLSSIKVPIDGEVLKEVGIARAIVEADCMIVVTHFKAHELSGFGGAIKNTGMGCASRDGKLTQHSTVAPKINKDNCKGCRLCTEYCPMDAISVSSKKARIDEKRCIGCGECIIICPQGAIEIEWNASPDLFQKKMAEHALGALKNKNGRMMFLNFLLQISPACDCYPNNDAPIVRDIGILSSHDPVAIDAASCDLVNNERSLPGTALKKVLKKGEDKWRGLFPSVDWSVQLDHGERIGLGTREYKLIKI